MKKDFKKYDLIEYSGDTFVVLENNGHYGMVEEYDPDRNGDVISPFYWEFEGEECILLKSKERILLPKELTAENGAKALLIGEFSESISIPNPDYCEENCEDCIHEGTRSIDDTCREEYFVQDVPVSWTTIKEIYKKIVKHYQNG